jgi:hypothetical protein
VTRSHDRYNGSCGRKIRSTGASHRIVRLEPPSGQSREFLVEVYGPLFAAVGQLMLPAPVRLSDFVNEREGFLRLTDVEFLANGPIAYPAPGHHEGEYLINKSGIELICQPAESTVEHHVAAKDDRGRVLWQAFSKMAGTGNPDLRVAKEQYQVQVHTDRFVVSAELHLAKGAAPESMLSNLPTKFVPVTDGTVRFIDPKNHVVEIKRKLMLVNRDHILLVELDRNKRAA